MTERQENILQAAQQLFAENGYANTSTKKIAQRAGVSEGLIFKHFKHKEGLLDAIVEQGLKQGASFFQELFEEENPKRVIELALNIPLMMIKEHKDYWKLQLSLKYQNPQVAEKYHNSEAFLLINNKIEQAFRELGYKNPEAEAKLIQTITSALFTQLIDQEEKEQKAFIDFIKSKYAV